MQHGQKIPFQVMQHAELGVPVMFIDGVPTAAERQPPSSPPSSPVLGQDALAHAILWELQGLRDDLEARSFEGRCRRLWRWLKGLVR